MANAVTSITAMEGRQDELMIKPFKNDPMVTALGMDLRLQKQIHYVYFNSQLDKITLKKTDCGWQFQGGAAITRKALTPTEVSAAIEQCYEPFLETIFAGNLPAGYQRGELSPEIVDFLMSIYMDAFKRDVLRQVFLGDTSSGDADYSPIDGVYKRLLAGVAAVDGTVDYGAVSDIDINQTNIETTLNGIYESQSRLLRAMPDQAKKFWVTGTVYDAWRRKIQTATGNQTVGQTDYYVNGIQRVAYNNVELVPLRFVDDYLNIDFLTGSPAAPTNPNRIILTVPTNHMLVLDQAAFANARMWYENKDDKFYATASAFIGYQYGYGELNVIAGF